MSNSSEVKELKEQASLVDLLERLGYKPAKQSRKEKLYISMLRNSDNNPSLSVNDELGVWFDHGTRKGGNIIDFGLAYWKQLTFSEVVEKMQSIFSIAPSAKSQRPRKTGNPVKIPHYIIEEVKDLGTHPAITGYLRGRGVFHMAKANISEIYYFVEDQKGERRHFFAAGWKNDRGGWEVRNKYFKGCLGPKAISFIQGNPKNLNVFEGYLNYLSWRTENQDADQSILVLNSLALLSAGIEKAKEFSGISIFFDRDQPGFQSTKEFMKALPYATDRSAAYSGFNDYNDKLVSSLAVKHPEIISAEFVEPGIKR